MTAADARAVVAAVSAPAADDGQDVAAESVPAAAGAADVGASVSDAGEDDAAESAATAVRAQARIGRPSVRSEQLAQALCARLEQGSTIHGACRAAGIHPDTYFAWVVEDQVFSERSLRARERGCDAIVDEAQDRLDHADNSNVSVVREQVQHMRWRASKLAPRRYGDRAGLELSGPGGGPVVISNDGSRARLLAKLNLDESAT